MTRLQHHDSDGTPRFVTFGTFKRYPIFGDERLILLFLGHLIKLRERHISILGYVIMPEHVHLVLLPPESASLGKIVGQLKGRTAQEIIRYWRAELVPVPRPLCTNLGARKHTIWQRRCFDRNIRNERELRQTLDYCHANPLKRGLVNSPEEWPWSSYGWYQGKRNVPLCIDDSAL